MHSTSTCAPRASAAAPNAERGTRNAERGTRRQMAGLEISDVGFVEVAPLAHVGEHRSAFEHVVEG
jgi:hypothetical protein